MNPNQVMPYQYSEPWIRPSLYPGGPHLVNNGVTPQFYCDNTNPVANFMSYPQAVLNPFASVTTTATNQVHPYPRRQALLQIVDPNTGKNILDDILNKPTEDGPIGGAGGGTTSSPASTSSNNGLQGEETRCQAPPPLPPPQNDEGGLGGTPTPQQMMMIPAQHSVPVPPWPQDLCQQLQPQQPMPAPESGPPQQQQQPPPPQQPQQQQQSQQQQQQHQQQQQQMLEPVVVQVPVVVYLRDPA